MNKTTGRTEKIIFIFLGIFLVIALVYGFFFFDSKISGKAVLDINADYKADSPLEGVLELSLKEGELIPSSSKIVLKNAGKIYEYNLEEIISDELIEGDFYIEEKSISGSGLGYGISGTHEIYPMISFTLDVYSSTTPKETKDESKEFGETPEEFITEKFVETIVEEELEEAPESVPSEEGKIPEKPSEEPIEEESAPNANGMTPEDGGLDVPSEEDKEPTITGGVINNLLKTVSNFFLRMTGQVSLDLETEISGEVSKDKPFTYSLSEDQSAQIKPGSVRVNSKKISDNAIDLDIEENTATVTTSYSEIKEGFGADYIGDGSKMLTINLADFNIIPEEGELQISLVYDEKEIISLTTLLGEALVEVPEEIQTPIEEIPEEPLIELGNITLNETENNLTIEVNETNVTLKKTISIFSDEEKRILAEEFGKNISIKTIKSELVNDRIVIRYELGDYWYEPSYDSSLSKEELARLMEDDRVRWLKDVIAELSKEIVSEELEEYMQDYSI